MEKTSNRWLIKVVLGLAVVAFVGISFVPLFLSNQNNSNVPTPSPTVASANTTELKEQEKGYQLVLQREPNNEAALQGLLETRLQLIQANAGEVKSVIDPLEKLTKLKPDRTEYQVLLAQAQQQVGNSEAAAQSYRNVLATKPGEMNALQGLVRLQLQENRPEAAIGLLQETIDVAPQANKLQPGSVDVTSVELLLGQVYADQNRYGEALAVYEKLQAANKNDFRPILAKALVLQDQGKPADAKPLFDSAASLAPAQYKDQIKQLATQAPPKPATPTPTKPPKP